MERRFTSPAKLPIVLEQRGTDPPMICGYAAVFYDGTPDTQYQLYDDLVERIMPTAFDRACREDDCRALFNHNSDFILGRCVAGTLRLAVDGKGLRYEIQVPDTQWGKDVTASIKRGDVSDSSFAFQPRKQTWVKGKPTVREINDCQLYDVGPVTYPAYAGTTTGVRSMGDAEEARKALNQWRTEEGRAAAIIAQTRARARCVELGI
jgi:HK97 family phage prohead protease